MYDSIAAVYRDLECWYADSVQGFEAHDSRGAVLEVAIGSPNQQKGLVLSMHSPQLLEPERLRALLLCYCDDDFFARCDEAGHLLPAPANAPTIDEMISNRELIVTPKKAGFSMLRRLWRVISTRRGTHL